MRIVIQILINALAIFLAVELVPGIVFEGQNDLFAYLIAGLILGLINFFLKPFLNIISIPLIVLTFGLFTIIINIAILWMLESLVNDLIITGFWSYFWGTVVVSGINIFLGKPLQRDLKKES